MQAEITEATIGVGQSASDACSAAMLLSANTGLFFTS
jgi:hypothetical protein